MVKSWSQRRLKRAVLEALRDRGYDRLGRRRIIGAAGTNNGNGGGGGGGGGVVVVEVEEEQQGMNLRGTLEINGFNNMALAEWKEVRRQIGLVVERVVLMCASKAGQAAPAPPVHIPKENKGKGQGKAFTARLNLEKRVSKTKKKRK